MFDNPADLLFPRDEMSRSREISKESGPAPHLHLPLFCTTTLSHLSPDAHLDCFPFHHGDSCLEGLEMLAFQPTAGDAAPSMYLVLPEGF